MFGGMLFFVEAINICYPRSEGGLGCGGKSKLLERVNIYS